MELDIKKVTVLPRSEWDRIKARLEPESAQEKNAAAIIAERERLHEKSIETVKNWSNTIQGQRTRKLEARKLRLENEEKELQKIDREEAKFQQAKRREAIDKAKTLQYHQTDRVKQFHGAMLLSEVLKERDQQVEMRKKISQLIREREAAYDSAYVNQYKHQNDTEQLHREKQVAARRSVADYQRQQRELKAKRLEKVVIDEVALGQYYLEQDEAHKTWVKNKNEKEREEKKALKDDILGQIKQKKKLAELELMQQKEEEEEIRLFSDAKNTLKNMRKKREREIQEFQQEQRRCMVATMEANTKEEEERLIVIANEVGRQKEAKIQHEEEAKAQKLHKTLTEIKNHRIAETHRLNQNIKDEKLKDEENLKKRIDDDNAYLNSEKEKLQNRRVNAQKLKVFHGCQINERAARERQHMDKELKCDLAEKEVLVQEEREFQKYAGEVIEKAKARNCNIYPLVKAAMPGGGGGHGPQNQGGIRPSFMSTDNHGVQLPTYQKDSTDAVKSIYGGKNINHDKKRFGFVW